MKISYSILTHNETESLSKLIDFLVINKDENDEIVILDDFSDNKETQRILDATVSIYDIKFEQRHLNKDADEIPNKELVKNIKEVIALNPEIELYWIPRVNTVEGITQQHIEKWGWNVNEKGWVNFPDYQGRIWKNKPNIVWKNEVHEVLEGYKSHTFLPAEEQFCFYHPKDINKQEKQNEFYDTI